MTGARYRRQEPPYCVQVELSLGCNLQCSFCGLNGVQERPNPKTRRYMTPETAEVVARRIAEAGWNPRLEFARRGEPTMNPHYAEIIGIFRRHLPRQQIMMTTNGGGLVAKPGPVPRILELFEAGLNVLLLDDYEGVGYVPKIRDAMRARNDPTGPVLYDYPAQKEANPHARHPRGTRMVCFVQDIVQASRGNHATLNNHAGHGAPLRDYPKPCAKPFREIGVNWDGSVDLCCIDWVGEYRIGNLHEMTLEEIWQSDGMNAARRYLVRGERSALRPCDGCDHPSYRVGLLPDPLGKADLPPPDERDAAVVREHLSRGPAERPTQLARERIGPRVRPESRERWGL